MGGVRATATATGLSAAVEVAELTGRVPRLTKPLAFDCLKKSGCENAPDSPPGG